MSRNVNMSELGERAGLPTPSGSLDDVDWGQVPIPAMYLHENWPLRWCVYTRPELVRIMVCANTGALSPVFRCAVSASGFHVAVAGQRGLLLYNRHSAKWR